MRTEEEVLKDFEKLGYKIKENTNIELVLGTKFFFIKFKELSKVYHTYFEDSKLHSTINMQEHKLLNELFSIWGWL